MSDIRELFHQFKDENIEKGFRKLNDRVLIVDGMNLFIRSFSVNPSLNDSGEHVGGIVGFLMGLGYAIRIVNPTRCIITFDGVGGSLRRRQLYPAYKDNRKTMTRLNRGDSYSSITEERASLTNQLTRLVEILEYLPVITLSIDHVEADDIIAYLSELTTERGGKSIIMSTDKDFLQLTSDSVEIFNPKHRKIYNQEMVVEKYQIHPVNFLTYRAMDGDVSDNINGIKGIGLKSLVKYFPELCNSTKVENAEILKKCELLKEDAKIYNKIISNQEIFERNLQLMNLSHVNISGSSKMKIIQMFDSHIKSLDKFGLTKFLIKDRLLSCFTDFNGWISSTFGTMNRLSAIGENSK